MFRVHNALTARAERVALRWLCEYMPKAITSDMLTLLGVMGAAIFCAGYGLSQIDTAWLWLAILGVVINWLGDSLDGSLARHLNIERPKYGFFLDHMSDALSMGLIGVGFGLSPYVHLTIAMVALMAYYLMAILSFVTCLVTGMFRISFHGVGPTEIRLVIIGLTLGIILWPVPTYHWGNHFFTLYDLFVGGLGMAMIATVTQQAIRTARELAVADPARAPKLDELQGASVSRHLKWPASSDV